MSLKFSSTPIISFGCVFALFLYFVLVTVRQSKSTSVCLSWYSPISFKSKTQVSACYLSSMASTSTLNLNGPPLSLSRCSSNPSIFVVLSASLIMSSFLSSYLSDLPSMAPSTPGIYYFLIGWKEAKVSLLILWRLRLMSCYSLSSFLGSICSWSLFIWTSKNLTYLSKAALNFYSCS